MNVNINACGVDIVSFKTNAKKPNATTDNIHQSQTKTRLCLTNSVCVSNLLLIIENNNMKNQINHTGPNITTFFNETIY